MPNKKLDKLLDRLILEQESGEEYDLDFSTSDEVEPTPQPDADEPDDEEEEEEDSEYADVTEWHVEFTLYGSYDRQAYVNVTYEDLMDQWEDGMYSPSSVAGVEDYETTEDSDVQYETSQQVDVHVTFGGTGTFVVDVEDLDENTPEAAGEYAAGELQDLYEVDEVTIDHVEEG